jgi:hypothetical protein
MLHDRLERTLVIRHRRPPCRPPTTRAVCPLARRPSSQTSYRASAGWIRPWLTVCRAGDDYIGAGARMASFGDVRTRPPRDNSGMKQRTTGSVASARTGFPEESGGSGPPPCSRCRGRSGEGEKLKEDVDDHAD